jgi:hypothetical protein
MQWKVPAPDFDRVNWNHRGGYDHPFFIMHLPQRPWYFKKGDEIRAVNFSVEARDCTALGYKRVNKDGSIYGEVAEPPKEEKPVLDEMTRVELMRLANELDLKVKSSASKLQVLEACEEALNG